jgi:hypothetical protein
LKKFTVGRSLGHYQCYFGKPLSDSETNNYGVGKMPVKLLSLAFALLITISFSAMAEAKSNKAKSDEAAILAQELDRILAASEEGISNLDAADEGTCASQKKFLGKTVGTISSISCSEVCQVTLILDSGEERSLYCADGCRKFENRKGTKIQGTAVVFEYGECADAPILTEVREIKRK